MIWEISQKQNGKTQRWKIKKANKQTSQISTGALNIGPRGEWQGRVAVK